MFDQKSDVDYRVTTFTPAPNCGWYVICGDVGVVEDGTYEADVMVFPVVGWTTRTPRWWNECDKDVRDYFEPRIEAAFYPSSFPDLSDTFLARDELSDYCFDAVRVTPEDDLTVVQAEVLRDMQRLAAKRNRTSA